MPDRPTIDAAVTFLTPAEQGRSMDVRDAPVYRPHLVVGDPGQRAARSGECYLGVAFSEDGRTLSAGAEHRVTLTLIYWPDIDYSLLTNGARFTIREGGHIVGWGEVVRGVE